MIDDKINGGEPDRSRVSGREDYEVEHFARRHGITAQAGRDLIAKHGNDRKVLDEAAARMRSF